MQSKHDNWVEHRTPVFCHTVDCHWQSKISLSLGPFLRICIFLQRKKLCVLEQGRVSTTETLAVLQLWVTLLEILSNNGAAGLSFGVVAGVFGQCLPCILSPPQELWGLGTPAAVLGFGRGVCSVFIQRAEAMGWINKCWPHYRHLSGKAE